VEHEAFEADDLPREAAQKLGFGIACPAGLDGQRQEDALIGGEGPWCTNRMMGAERRL
jgi:hypothetical protein